MVAAVTVTVVTVGTVWVASNYNRRRRCGLIVIESTKQIRIDEPKRFSPIDFPSFDSWALLALLALLAQGRAKEGNSTY